MAIAIKIKMLLAAREMTLQDLANKITPKTSAQNISQKLKRDNILKKNYKPSQPLVMQPLKQISY